MLTNKHTANGYDLIAVVNGSKPYKVCRRCSDGVLTCSCPSWVNRSGTKHFEGFTDTCKHIRAVLVQDDLTVYEPTSFGLDFLMARAEKG